jgi:23S rRNA (cytidine1920-2'-O)/16S rRNA (cytidine1409-2'-O)-methyltransferase
MTVRERADRLLVARGLFESRSRAQAAIAAGLVTADGVPVRKASEEISSAAVIAAAPEHPFVSRGGVKLAAALDHFHLDVTGRVCLDVGASTGGFAEVLILRGAQRVYAIDVGRDQLHPRLRGRDDGKILTPRAMLLALIKPQFEAARRDIKKGIVRDAAVHATICDDIGAFLISLGWRVGGVVPSAIRGGDGNREFFIEAERG